jgi:magnesium chelatase family protein
MDLTVDVPAVGPDILDTAPSGESSAEVLARVVAARARQRERYGEDGPRTNAELTPAALNEHCRLDAAASRLLRTAAEKFQITARGYDRVRKVARTIADLAGDDDIGVDPVAEALQFRMLA